MKKYKLIGTQINWPSFTPGETYDADYISDQLFSTCTVQTHATFSPKDWELVEEFTLPENWYIIRTFSNYEEINKWAKTKSTENFNSDSGKVFYLNEVSSTLTKNYGSYTEITFDQFKKYVLKQDTMNIIGYKFKESCEIYRKAALEVCNTVGNWENSLADYDISITQTGYIDRLIKAEVLYLWFDPIYKEEKKLPKINNYDGSYNNNIVKYGCAEFYESSLRDLYKCRNIGSNRTISEIKLDSGVVITFAQLEEIIDYLDSQK